MMINLRSALACASATIALTSAGAAHAQSAGGNQAAQGDGYDVTTIIVTAQRRAESIQDVPVSVQVTTAEQLERQQVNNLDDLQRVTASVEIVTTNSGERTGGARIRGIGTNTQSGTYTALGSVAIVVDEVPQGALTLGGLFDMAQVEVLRGPQGTLFGQTASAGVVNVTSVQPKFDAVSGNVDIQWSDNGTLGSEFGKFEVNAGLNMPLSATSAVRIAGVYGVETGVQRNTYLDKDNKVTRTGLRVTYLNELTPNLTFRLQGEYQKQDEEGMNFYGYVVAPTNNPAKVAALQACGVTFKPEAQEYCTETTSRQSYEGFGVNAKFDLDLEPFTLTSITSYRERERWRESTNYEPLVGTPQAGDFLARDPGDQFTQELRVTSRGSGPFHYVAGAFYFKYDVAQKPLSDNLPFGDASEPVGFGVCFRDRPTCVVGPTFTRNEADIESWAVFADGNFDVTDTLNLFGGLRYTKHDATARIGRNGPITNEVSKSWKNVSGRAGIRFTPEKGRMFYASVNRGFKGGLIEVNSNPAIDPVILEPEEPWAYEIGTKLAFLNNRLAVNADIFYVKHKNYQTRRSVFASAGVLTSVSENIPELKAKGFELDVYGDITDNLSVNLGYTYNDLPYPDDYVDQEGATLTGLQIAWSPKHKLVMGGEYHKEISDNGMQAFGNVNVVYKGKTRLIERAADRYLYPAHFTVGAAIGVRPQHEGWNASLYVRNLFGENEPFAALPDGEGLRYWTTSSATLREVGLTVGFKF